MLSHRNLQTLAHEIFKVKINMTPEVLTEIFLQKESNYSLRNSTALQGIKTVIGVLTHFVIPPHFVIPDALCNPPCHTLLCLTHFVIHFATLCNPPT